MLSICSSQPLLTAEHEKNLFFPVVWLQPKMGEKKYMLLPQIKRNPNKKT